MITSWVSFLIPPEVVPGRMALLVTLFLVLINIFNNVTAITPNTEGMTAISSWMLGNNGNGNNEQYQYRNLNFSMHLLPVWITYVLCSDPIHAVTTKA